MLIAEMESKLNYVDFSDEISATTLDVSRMEDVLTSNVFGILKNIDLHVLNSILEEAGIRKLEDLPKFSFWPKYDDRTEPDLVIITPTRYIVIEVKYQSDFEFGSPEKLPQILREIRGAMTASEGREIDFLAITKEQQHDGWKSKVYQLPDYIVSFR